MNVIKAYYILYIKILTKAKLTYVWSIILPAVMIIMSRSYGYTELDMRFYYAYIIFTSYLFGVGLHIIEVRQGGGLKVFFSIREARYEFFIAMVLTQITYSITCICILNLMVVLLYKLNFLILSLEMVIMVLGALPAAFASCALSLFKKIRYENANTLATILIMICAFSVGSPSKWNILNPLYLTSNIILINSWKNLIAYISVSAAAILLGLISIRNYSVMSYEVR